MLGIGEARTLVQTEPLSKTPALQERKGSRGCRPGITGTGLKGATTGDKIQWKFPPSRELSVLEKKMVMAEVVRLTLQTAFKAHVYSFASRVYSVQAVRGGTNWCPLHLCPCKSSDGQVGPEVERSAH